MVYNLLLVQIENEPIENSPLPAPPRSFTVVAPNVHIDRDTADGPTARAKPMGDEGPNRTQRRTNGCPGDDKLCFHSGQAKY